MTTTTEQKPPATGVCQGLDFILKADDYRECDRSGEWLDELDGYYCKTHRRMPVRLPRGQ